MTSPFTFFLGGRDLEMLTIRDLVAEVAPDRLFDKGLSWGAKASAYGDEIAGALAAGSVPVLVELENDLGLPLVDAVALTNVVEVKVDVKVEVKGDLKPGQGISVDHHGSRAGEDRPTSLEQVFRLLDLPRRRWTRWMDLVAANDRGHVREMRRMGATPEQIETIRAADRRAQGITPEEERAAEQALRGARSIAGGRMLVVDLPHARTAAVVDRVEMSERPPSALLVVSPAEVNFYGDGDAIRMLDSRFPGGWSGGALPDRGFWGHAGVSALEVEQALLEWIEHAAETR